eukprot:3701443-Pyramimonas_sp.AAC.1
MEWARTWRAKPGGGRRDDWAFNWGPDLSSKKAQWAKVVAWAKDIVKNPKKYEARARYRS